MSSTGTFSSKEWMPSTSPAAASSERRLRLSGPSPPPQICRSGPFATELGGRQCPPKPRTRAGRRLRRNRSRDHMVQIRLQDLGVDVLVIINEHWRIIEFLQCWSRDVLRKEGVLLRAQISSSGAWTCSVSNNMASKNETFLPWSFGCKPVLIQICRNTRRGRRSPRSSRIVLFLLTRR